MSTLKNPRLADLSERRYRIVLEESWQHERPEIRNPDRIWYEQIPCQGGAFIGLYSLILQLSTPRVKNAKKVWEAIKGVEGARAHFRFDGEAVIYFPIEAVHIVAELATAEEKEGYPKPIKQNWQKLTKPTVLSLNLTLLRLRKRPKFERKGSKTYYLVRKAKRESFRLLLK